MEIAGVFLFDKPKVGKMKVTFEVDVPENCDHLVINCHAEARIKQPAFETLLGKQELDVELIDENSGI